MNAVPVDETSAQEPEPEGEEASDVGQGVRAESSDAVVEDACVRSADTEADADAAQDGAPEAGGDTGSDTEPEEEAVTDSDAEAEADPEEEQKPSPKAEEAVADDADADSDDAVDEVEDPGADPDQDEDQDEVVPASEVQSGPSQEATPLPAPAPAPAPEARRLDTDPERTREAPLPPLDLLAHLTTTPPPPDTPTRTLVRRIEIWTPLFLLLAVVSIGVQALRPLPEPALGGARTSYVLPGGFDIPWPDHGQGAVRVPGSGEIAVFGEQKPVPTASVAKIMTAYVILREHPLKKGEEGPQITVDAKAVEEGKAKHESRIEGLTAGATFSQQDMLKMLMIPSGNNAARLLARWDGGGDSTASFVAKMNAAAEELGMDDTTYTDPSGLDPRTVSTAVDQLKLAEAVMKFDVFRAIVAMPNATVKGLPEPLYNNNDSLLLAGLSIKGIKTGSSTPAGGTLVWAAYKTVGSQTPLILGSMMGQRVDGPDPNATKSLELVKSNSEKVVAAVRSGLGSVTVVSKGEVVGHLDDGFGRRTPVVAAMDLKVIGVPGQQLKAVLTDHGKALPRGAKAGTEIGTLTVGGGPQAPSVPVTVRSHVAEPTFTDKLARLG